MDHHVQFNWAPACPPQHHPPPVDVRTPYQAGNDWTFFADAQTQTSSVQSLVRQVCIVDMQWAAQCKIHFSPLRGNFFGVVPLICVPTQVNEADVVRGPAGSSKLCNTQLGNTLC